MVLDVAKPSDPKGLVLESWAQGFMFGSLLMMACVTVANMRRKVLLHKLILIEVSGLSRLFVISEEATHLLPRGKWHDSGKTFLLCCRSRAL